MFIGRMRKPATDHACARRKPMGACSPSATTRAAQRAQPLHGMPPGDPRACAQATAPPPPPPPRVHVPRLLPQHLSDADAATHARAKTRGVTRHGAVATGTLDPDAQLALLTVNLLAGVSYLSPAHGITMHRWSRKTVATPIHLPNPNPAQTMVARNARLPHLCQNRIYYPLNRESGVLARTHCHYILTPLYHFSNCQITLQSIVELRDSLSVTSSDGYMIYRLNTY